MPPPPPSATRHPPPPFQTTTWRVITRTNFDISQRLATRCFSKGSLSQNLEGHVTKFEPHKTLKLIVRDKLAFAERVVLHRVVPQIARHLATCFSSAALYKPLPRGSPNLIPISIKNNPFLKLILLEQTPLLTCFVFATRQKWLISKRINLRKALFSIDVGVENGKLDCTVVRTGS